MSYALRTLLADAIDYAGLFPPAALDMDAAARSYAAYRRGPHAWMLGRFVVPAARLHELRAVAGRLAVEAAAGGPWRIAALAGPDIVADMVRVEAFREHGRSGAATKPFVLDALELRPVPVRDIAGVAATVPRGTRLAFEIPLDAPDLGPALDATAQAGAAAKARLGGTVPEAFPAPVAVATWLVESSRRGVPVKATAGLHHPLRGEHPVTYEPSSPLATMHGFLNLFTAATFAVLLAHTMVRERIVERMLALLDERDPGAVRFDDEGLAWRDERVPRASLAAARQFVLAVGSCSFEEPVRELRELGYPID